MPHHCDSLPNIRLLCTWLCGPVFTMSVNFTLSVHTHCITFIFRLEDSLLVIYFKQQLIKHGTLLTRGIGNPPFHQYLTQLKKNTASQELLSITIFLISCYVAGITFSDRVLCLFSLCLSKSCPDQK